MALLSSPRLTLIPFQDAHLDALHAMNADPEVMRYISGRPETRDETLAMVAARTKAGFAFDWESRSTA